MIGIDEVVLIPISAKGSLKLLALISLSEIMEFPILSLSIVQEDVLLLHASFITCQIFLLFLWLSAILLLKYSFLAFLTRELYKEPV